MRTLKMLRKNMQTIGKLVGIAVALLLPYQTQASCAEFEAEAEAYEGVVPKFADDGSIRAIVMYGEGTFLVPKRSLITTARREAELTARRAYSEFLNSGFKSSSEMSKITQEYSETNSKGMTGGQVEELKTALDYMANSSSSVQSGLVKLDECVDTEGKYLLVELGWKPAFSDAAAGAATKMAQGAAASNGQQAAASKDNKSAVKPAEGYRKKSSLKDDF